MTPSTARWLPSAMPFARCATPSRSISRTCGNMAIRYRTHVALRRRSTWRTPTGTAGCNFTLADRLYLSPHDKGILERLLQNHLPYAEAWTHGSRVNGRSHDGCDLYLAVRAPELTGISRPNNWHPSSTLLASRHSRFWSRHGIGLSEKLSKMTYL